MKFLLQKKIMSWLLWSWDFVGSEVVNFHALTTLFQSTFLPTLNTYNYWSSAENKSFPFLLIAFRKAVSRKKIFVFSYRKVSIRKQFFTGFSIKSCYWVNIFICLILFAKDHFLICSLHFSIFEHNATSYDFPTKYLNRFDGWTNKSQLRERNVETWKLEVWDRKFA